MDLADAVGERNAVGLVPSAFTVVELVRAEDPFAGREWDYDTLESALLGDSRFVRLSGKGAYDERFLLDVTLFRFLVRVNMRVAALDEHRVADAELVFAVNGLRSGEGWDRPPPEIVRWGRSLGLITACHSPDEYAFPLARVLSSLPECSLGTAARVLDRLGEERVWDIEVGGLLERCVQKGFSAFGGRAAEVVQARSGLLTGEEMSLAETGSVVGLTAERVRQLEGHFWRRLRPGGRGRERTRAPFVAALVCDFIDERGSLIVRSDSPKGPLRRFLAKSVGIPQARLCEEGFTLLGIRQEDLAGMCSCDGFPDAVDAAAVAAELERDHRLPLVEGDVTAVAGCVAQARRNRLKAAQRVYLAMRAIGQPAHYSEIAEVHNVLFPERARSERNIHGVLNRAEYGVVWIGVKGTYALEEWGYERPSATLFETVAQIVEEKYRETGKPVPLAVIAAEMGKRRPIVKPVSLSIAAYWNDRLERSHANCFVPKAVGEGSTEDVPAEELDRILREFQEGGKSHDSPQGQGDMEPTEGHDRHGEARA